MKWSKLPWIVRFPVQAAIGVVMLLALYSGAKWSQPLWNPSAFHWKYSETATADGGEQSLSIKARDSTMTAIDGRSFTPSLSIICDRHHVYVEVAFARPICIGPCGASGTYDIAETFVTDLGAGAQQSRPASLYWTGSDPTRAKRFYEFSDNPELAREDAPKAVAFVHRLAAAREYWIENEQNLSKFDTSDLAAQMPRLQGDCPALR